MNLWRPRVTTKSKILEQNELFLFKYKNPENMIVLEEKLCINPPLDWSSSIVTGKSYEIKAGSEGLRLYEEAQHSFRLANHELSVADEPLERRLGK